MCLLTKEIANSVPKETKIKSKMASTAFVYKCRLCGKEFTEYHVFGWRWDRSMGLIMKALDHPQTESNEPGMITIHLQCGNDKKKKRKRPIQYGVGDFIGVKKVKF